MTKRRPKRTYTDEFRIKMVQLYNNGKPRAEIIREYDLTASAFNKWVKRFNDTGSFTEADNRSDHDKALIKLQKENERLKMENDILKQAALIMGRKDK